MTQEYGIISEERNYTWCSKHTTVDLTVKSTKTANNHAVT